jgi:hypothetical protein
MLKNFNPFDIFIGLVAMLGGFTAIFMVVVLFNDGILHWIILIIIASYYLGKFIRERTGL